MKKLIVALLTSVFIFAFAYSHNIQTKTSFDDINFTPELEKLIDENTSNVLFLFGIVCVSGCPIGNYIQKIKCDTNVVYFLPIDSNADDVLNFERGLRVKGKIIIANENIVEFVKLLAQKLKLEDYRENLVMELKKKKIINLSTK